MCISRILLWLALLLVLLLLAACQPIQVPPATAPASPTGAGVVAATTAPDATATATEQATASARPTRAPRVKLTAEHQKLTSQALAGNLLGDPTERGFYVVLPSDYATSAKRYPVVYGLHGYTGNEYTDPMAFQRVQELALRRGDVKEMILVFPDGSNKLGGSMYLRSPTIGDYETYLTKELVEYIDANYRTIPDRNSRGIMGCSMGADGAMHLALKYPDVYSVAAPYSGTYVWSRDPWLTIGAEGFKQEPADLGKLGEQPIETNWEIAMVAAVASNPDKPPFFLDMPYVRETGQAKVAPGFVEKLEAFSPVQDAKNYLQQPLRLRGILVYHGRQDDFAPVGIVRDFSALLTELGIEHEYLEVDAMHCNMDLEPILKFMSEHLVFEEPAQ